MSKTLACQVSPGEVWAALEEDGALIGLRVAREGTADVVGGVFLGRIVALRPELPAVLVDIGLDRPGFLDAHDVDRKRGIDGLTEGQALIVEVTKAARADKAAGLRVLRPADTRRAALEATARDVTPPARLDQPEPAIIRAARPLLRDDIASVLVDDRGAMMTLRRNDPDLAERVAFHGDDAPLFETLGVADQVDAVLQPRVPLPGGGAIFIEASHAATMIDVDGGERGALAANRAAVGAIARQIALRNLAGPIVVDFVNLKNREDRDTVTAALKAALAEDNAKVELLGWTKLGHFELIRPRREPPLADLLFEQADEGTMRKTALTVALET
ncbi:MAG TPA: ribonuclease E/G, partial [Stellaceae bacterium]|nr:ribonuclease E/G [Stellaceae bacterium]